MDSSQKQFKALSMAQPIKKQINQTLIKLQTQKRKFLSSQREQANLRDDLLKVRRQLNEAKLLEPKTRVKQNKNIQINMSINNTDRLYLNTVNKISEMRTKIDVHRKQIEKYKRLVRGVNQEMETIKDENDQLERQLVKQQQKNQTIKEHLMDYRTLNMRNTDEFKHSFHALHRSTVKEENQRKKSQALRKSFNHDELKNSNIVRLAEVEQHHSLIHQTDPNHQHDIYMTNCIPLVKERIRILIHNNKERIKISENYKKFGEDLQNMFSIMQEYKGRDDVAFIADEFVMKEKQLKKIEQYIGKLQNRLMWYKAELQKIKNSDLQLIKELNQDENQEAKVKDKNYINLQNQVKHSIQIFKQKEHENSIWLEKIGQILAPLASGEIINRTNVDKILGMIEEKCQTGDKKPISQMKDQKLSNKSPSKAMNPTIDQKDLKSIQSMQLLSYQKLREYAKDYISVKK